MINSSIHVLISMLSILVVGVIIFKSIKNIQKLAGIEFLFMQIFCLIWALGSFGEMVVATFDEKLLIRNLTQIGSFLLTPSVYLFVCAYTGERKYLKRISTLITVLMPIAAIILIFTDGYHHLMRNSVSIIGDSDIKVIAVDQTLVGKIFSSFNFLIIIVAEIKLILFLMKNPKKLKKQIWIIVIAILFPFFATLIKNSFSKELAIIIPNSNFFVISSFMISYGMKHFHFFSINPISRERVFNVIQEGIIIFSRDGLVVDSNDSAKKLASTLFEIPSLEQELSITDCKFEELKACIQKREEAEIDLCVQNDTVAMYLNVCMYNTNSDGNSLMIAVIRDVTDEKEYQKLLKLHAETDGFTEVLNRTYFEKYVGEQLNKDHNRNTMVAMFMMDLDFFKSINDHFGHSAGDYVLKETVNILKGLCPDYGFFSRLGGEEFGMFFPLCEIQTAEELAENQRKAIEEHQYEYMGQSIKVTISIGLAVVKNSDQINYDLLILIADRALYQAKNNGRNRIQVLEGM